MAKEPLLKPNIWNKLTGKQLIDMGYHVDTDGYLIAATLSYDVWLNPWKVHQPKNRKYIKQKEG